MKVKRFSGEGSGDCAYKCFDDAIRIIAGEPKSKVEKTSLDPKELDIQFTYPHNEWALSKTKKVCIMFSGGCDSLSLALRHLEAGDNVALCHIIFNPDETPAAYMIYKILKDIYKDQVLGFFKLFNEITIDNGEDTIGWNQQPITAFYASMIPRCLKDNCTAIESAYIMNDDAVSYIKELRGIYNNAMAFKTMDAKVPYKFPLSKTKHFENVDYIRKIEEKYNVVFPVGSAERPTISAFKFSKADSVDCMVYLYSCNTSDCKKENKVNDTCGYIMFEGSLPEKKQKELEEKVFK
jgi:hypothetical protein